MTTLNQQLNQELNQQLNQQLNDDQILSKWYSIREKIKQLEEEEKQIKKIICETLYLRNSNKIFGSEFICTHENYSNVCVLSPRSRLSISKR